MKDSSDCPGRFRCHGPASWCDQCGDVDLVCDDPACDTHLRHFEKADILDAAEEEYRRAEAEFRAAEKAMVEAKAAYERHRKGNAVMVARGPKR